MPYQFFLLFVFYFGADPQYDEPIQASSFQVVPDNEIVAMTPPNYGGRVDLF